MGWAEWAEEHDFDPDYVLEGIQDGDIEPDDLAELDGEWFDDEDVDW